ncbi:unnamed protein product [Schistosoma curassoni]|uniref:Uncharacterized protein n=1 Tax=Schistosoma curassoni TaxID=6186 RepID=A0A183JTA0_9TREM|nr:unnamed protein product [Schistosoma curassoni]
MYQYDSMYHQLNVNYKQRFRIPRTRKNKLYFSNKL